MTPPRLLSRGSPGKGAGWVSSSRSASRSVQCRSRRSPQRSPRSAGARRATRSSTERRRIRRCSTRRSPRTASRCATRARSSTASSRSSPARASSCPASPPGGSVSKNHLAWTFKLRKGVSVLGRDAVQRCRRLHELHALVPLPGAAAERRAELLLADGLRRVRQTGTGQPGPATRASTRAARRTASTPCRSSSAGRRPRSSSAIGLPNFGIASPTALKKYQADAGTVDATGVFHPTGTFATQHPIGTGPYMLQSWQPGNKLVLVANPKYWGTKPKIKRIIYIPIGDPAARLQALQSGEVQAYDNVGPAGLRHDPGQQEVQAVPAAADEPRLRRHQPVDPADEQPARAAGSGVRSERRGRRQGVLRRSRDTPATQFLPPSLVGFAKKGVPTYPYDPAKSIALLKQAGLTPPVKVDFWYPTSVSRPYMPDPQRNFEAFAASLEQGGLPGRAALGAVASRLPRRRAGRQGSAVPVRLEPGLHRSGELPQRPLRRQDGAVRLRQRVRCSRCWRRRTPSPTRRSGRRCTSRRASR